MFIDCPLLNNSLIYTVFINVFVFGPVAQSAEDRRYNVFDFTGDDSEDEDGLLCNTMLLVGPHGVGKTAAV